MDAKQLQHHHVDAKHFKCVDPDCKSYFRTKNNMYAHYKTKHDPEIYKRGVIEFLEGKLSHIEWRIERNPLAAVTLQEKRQRLLKRLGRLKGLSPEEVTTPVLLEFLDGWRLETYLLSRKVADPSLVTNGAAMTKCENSESVINIVLPREVWEPIQQVRTQHVKDARCGEHKQVICFSHLD